MSNINEQLVEDIAFTHFRSIGAEVKRGVEIDNAGERSDTTQYLLSTRLLNALKQLNPTMPQGTLEGVARTLGRPPHPTLAQNNRWFHTLMTDGVDVEYRDPKSGETRGGRARLIDFEQPEKNDLLVVRQLTVVGPSGKWIRPDLTVFVNGMPIAVIELKDPADEQADLNSAIRQFQRYKDTGRGAPDFFCTQSVAGRLGWLADPRRQPDR